MDILLKDIEVPQNSIIEITITNNAAEYSADDGIGTYCGTCDVDFIRKENDLNCTRGRLAEIKCFFSHPLIYQVACKCGKNTATYTSAEDALKEWNKKNIS